MDCQKKTKKKHTDVGCHMGWHFSGALAYYHTDDMPLLSQIRSVLITLILVEQCEKTLSIEDFF